MFKPADLASCFQRVREEHPLVHNITNYVVMNFSANALLAVGASPVMAHAPEEVKEMVALAGSLVINIGTLSGPWIQSMGEAMKEARVLNRPIVFDPVGVGATCYRTETANTLLKVHGATVIRGNASEILALGGSTEKTKGVESSTHSETALKAAQDLAQKLPCVVCVSGETDFITDGLKTYALSNGDSMMARITGMGCVASALIGAFLAVEKSALKATISAMAVMGIAGEIAKKKSEGVGSFQVAFLDALDRFDEKNWEYLKWKELS